MTALSDAETLNYLRDLEQPIHRMADQVSMHAKALDEARYRQILDWLSPVRVIEHHERHSEARLPGSGTWLFDRREYLDWQNSSASSTFLLCGLPGSGKSSLSSGVVDSILNQSSRQTCPALLAYFYCSKNPAQVELSEPCEIMRNVVRQLAISNLSKRSINLAIMTEYEQRETKDKLEGFDVTRLSLKDSVRLVLEIIGSDPAIIVLDAIDEVQPESRYELIEALQNICRESSGVVKILVTSRDDNQVLGLLRDVSTIRINAECNRGDMENFVNHQVALAAKSCRLLGGDVSNELQKDLAEALTNNAGEV